MALTRKAYLTALGLAQVEGAVLEETLAILDMWRDLVRSYRALPASGQVLVSDPKDLLALDIEFFGFDPDVEAEHFAAASTLIHEMQLFPELEGAESIAHLPSLRAHRAMLVSYERFRGWRALGPLTASEQKSIMAAVYSPGQMEATRQTLKRIKAAQRPGWIDAFVSRLGNLGSTVEPSQINALASELFEERWQDSPVVVADAEWAEWPPIDMDQNTAKTQSMPDGMAFDGGLRPRGS